MKRNRKYDPLGFWEVSRKLWRENWWYYLFLLIIGVLFGLFVAVIS